MKTFTAEKHIYSFKPHTPFAFRVKTDELFCVEMNDCYNGIFQKETDLRTPETDTSKFDAAVGPIYIEDACMGDTLCVEILDIQLSAHGVMVVTKGLGVLGDKVDVPSTKIIPIKEDMAVFSETIKVPVNPMIGVMGVLPQKGEYRCTVPGDFGGNMDTKELTIGTKVYLPVFQDGAGLAVSDLHACMGDGELSGTGLEIAGKVFLKATVKKDLPIQRPLVETKDAFYIIATNATFEGAYRIAAFDAVSFLEEKTGLDFADSYRLMSACCDIRISQIVNGVYTLKIRIPKMIIKH